MNISLRLLRYVAAAADSGNVTEAARRLKVSQPSISAAIAELEQMIGITIFVRHHAKGVTLTPAGEKLIQGARLLLNQAKEFSNTAEALSDIERGEITIGCLPLLAARFMPSLIYEFCKRHPRVALNFEEGDQEHLMRDLAKGRIEMAIAYASNIPSGFDAKRVLTLPPVVTLPANHSLASLNSVSLAELEKEPLIFHEPDDYILSLFDGLGLQPNIALRLRSFELIRGLVARGHGYTLSSIVPVTAFTYDGGHVITKPLRDKLASVEVAAVMPKAVLLRPSVKIFSDFVETSLKRSIENGGQPVEGATAAA